MLAIFEYAFTAVASILLLSLFGYFLKRKGYLDEALSGKMNSFAFRFCLSVSLFTSVYNIGGLSDLPWKLLLFSVVFLTAAFLLGMVCVRFMTKDNPKRGVLAQTFFRSNSAVLGLPLAVLLGGDETAQIMSPLMMLPAFYNVYAVIALMTFGPEDKKGSGMARLVKSLKGIARNPLILGIFFGMLCLAVRALEPCGADGQPVFTIKKNLPALYNAISSLSKIASPLMLILLGARFSFKAAGGLIRHIVSGVALRLLIMPACGFALLYVASSVLHLFEAPPAVYQAMVGILATPCAVSSTVMAAEMDGDETLASQLVVWTSLLCPFTLFVFISFLRAIGLL